MSNVIDFPGPARTCRFLTINNIRRIRQDGFVTPESVKAFGFQDGARGYIEARRRRIIDSAIAKQAAKLSWTHDRQTKNSFTESPLRAVLCNNITYQIGGYNG